MTKQLINKKQAAKLSNNKLVKKLALDIATCCDFFKTKYRKSCKKK